ncbi:MAG: PAS domain S-box protein [Nitrospirae bacterium]|nr:PAS domain S-box protein [Nitrospirota bacterium]
MMNDRDKTHGQLIEELESLRRQADEMKNAQTELLESENRYRTLFQQSPDAIVAIDPETALPIEFNDRILDMLGYTKEEFLKLKIADYEAIESPKEIKAHIEKVLFEGKDEFETRLRTKTGELKDVIVSIRVIELSGKRVFHNIFRDITGRKRAEEALRESEDRCRGIADNIGIGVSTINTKMEILSLNSQMKRWFPDIDVSKRPVCYKAFNNPPRDEICRDCPAHKTLTDGHVYESVIETPAGAEVRNYRIISSPLKNKNGNTVAAVNMVDDITERKQLEAERERLIGELQTALAKVKQLSGMLPICSYCKKIRDDNGYWKQIEAYISEHSEALFSHGMCPDCAKEAMKEVEEL